MLKIAAFAAWFQGLGFGLPCIYGIWYLWKEKKIAHFMGFPTYGNGPFEKIGVHSTPGLLISFLLVCVMECVAAQMIWNGEKGGAVLSLIIIPLELFFYIGFALPFGPPVMLLRIVLVIWAWSSFQ